MTSDDVRLAAADLQLEACLHEVQGPGPAAGFAARIAERLREVAALAPVARPSWRTRLWAAALILGGASVVAGVAWLRHTPREQPAAAPDAQEPQRPAPESQGGAQALATIVTAAVRDLAQPGRRDDALAILQQLGASRSAAATLALLTEMQRNKSFAADALRETIDLVTTAGRPADPSAVPSREQLAEWLRDLQDPPKKAAALAHLRQAYAVALAVASEALQQEQSALLSRPEVVALLREAVQELQQVHARQYKARMLLADAHLTTRGTTMIADYSDNRVIEVDEQGQVVWELDDVFGAWDAELLPNGNVLITEFSVSRVQEVTRDKRVVWVFEDLKNPYGAQRLPNGNTLIGDTFGSRVIEVNPQKQIVWKYDKQIRPFHAERLANGNTLIADVLKDRVIEVSPQGEIVWQVTGMNNVHDAERLPNGNTLITLRSAGKVIEVDCDGKIVWQLDNLSSPSDADRLPNGNTLVAENNAVREFDPKGKVVWKREMTWAVEANRY